LLGANGSAKLDMSSFSETAPTNHPAGGAGRGKRSRQEVGVASGGEETAAALLKCMDGNAEEAMRLLCNVAKM
jgi:hypothetical protein